MADSVVVRITENRLVVTKQDPKAVIAAPYVKYVYTLTLKGFYTTLELLQAGVADPAVGDAYGVGSAAPFTVYIWDGSAWVDNGLLKGDRGDNAPEVIEQYSADTTEWHADYMIGVDWYLKRSFDGGETYGEAIPLGGILTTFAGGTE